MSTRTLAADQTARPAVGCRRDGAAMRDRASLIEAHIPPLRCFACTLRRGDRQAAGDLVHDCLERAVSRWQLRRAEGDVRGWLYTILYNRFLTDEAPSAAPQRSGCAIGSGRDELLGSMAVRIGHWRSVICSLPLRHCPRSNGRWRY